MKEPPPALPSIGPRRRYRQTHRGPLAATIDRPRQGEPTRSTATGPGRSSGAASRSPVRSPCPRPIRSPSTRPRQPDRPAGPIRAEPRRTASRPRGSSLRTPTPEHTPFICIGLWTCSGIHELLRAQFATRQYGTNSAACGQNPVPSVTRQRPRRGTKLTVRRRTRRKHRTHRVSAAPRSAADATGAQNPPVEQVLWAARNVTSPIQCSTGLSHSSSPAVAALSRRQGVLRPELPPMGGAEGPASSWPTTPRPARSCCQWQPKTATEMECAPVGGQGQAAFLTGRVEQDLAAANRTVSAATRRAYDTLGRGLQDARRASCSTARACRRTPRRGRPCLRSSTGGTTRGGVTPRWAISRRWNSNDAMPAPWTVPGLWVSGAARGRLRFSASRLAEQRPVGVSGAVPDRALRRPPAASSGQTRTTACPGPWRRDASRRR